MRYAVEHGIREPAKMGRELRRFNFQFGKLWQRERYAIKQVAPIVKEEPNEIIVVTVYTFYY